MIMKHMDESLQAPKLPVKMNFFQIQTIFFIPLVLSVFLPSFAQAQAPDPCSYITQDEAAALLGEAVKPGRSGKVSGFAAGLSCTYFTAAPLAQRGGTGSVRLTIYDKTTMVQEDSIYDSPRAYFEKVLQSSGSGHDTNPIIEDLGEKAFRQTGNSSLHILANEMYFVLSIKDLAAISSAKGRDDLEAKLAAHRLQKCKDAALGYILPRVK
jgi:hypothetical protein